MVEELKIALLKEGKIYVPVVLLQRLRKQAKGISTRTSNVHNRVVGTKFFLLFIPVGGHQQNRFPHLTW